MQTSEKRAAPEELREYQIQDLAFYIANPRCANLSDPGTGKTPSVCVYAYYLWVEKKVKTAWAMPKSLLKKNYDELLRFTEFQPDEVVIVDGTPSQRAAQMADPRAKVFLMGFKRFSDDWRTLRKHHPDMKALLVDEIHMGYGGAKSDRTKQMWIAMREMEHFLAMTGTLVNGRLDSAYPTIHVIEPRYYPTYNNFLNHHALMDQFGKIYGWRNHDKLKTILKHHTIRRTFEEVYGAEEKVILVEKCEMSPKQREAYSEFEDKAMLELTDDYLDGTASPGVHAIRCRQICAHPEFFGLEVGMTGKDEMLDIHLENHRNTGEPLIIFSALVPEMERIFKLVHGKGMTVGLINGSTSMKDRVLFDEAFRSGKLQVIVASPATAGVGFNWAHVDRMIFCSMDYQDSSFFQGYRRAIRGKRTKPLAIHVLCYRDSVEERILQVVTKKSRMANAVDETKEVFELAR